MDKIGGGFLIVKVHLPRVQNSGGHFNSSAAVERIMDEIEETKGLLTAVEMREFGKMRERAE